MNRKGLILSGILYLLVLTGFAFLAGELLLLAVPLALYFALGLFFSPGDLDLTAEREISSLRARTGRVVRIRVRIQNRGGRILVLKLRDQIPPGCTVIEGETGWLGALPEEGEVELRYAVQPERGYYQFNQIALEAGDPFGVLNRRRALEAGGRFYIHPRYFKIDRVAIRPRITNVYSGFIPARVGGPGVEFFGVREYQPGDPIRWINWRASARQAQALFVNQYQQERVADVGLIVDTRASSQVQGMEGASIFERSIEAAGSLTNRFLQDGNRVGLLLYGTSLNWTFPQYGKVQRQRIMDQLSGAEVGESRVFEKLENLPTQILPRRAQLVFISPLQEQDVDTLVQLAARGYAVMVISPDPVRYQWEQLAEPGDTLVQAYRLARLERRLILKRLRQAGINVLDWDPKTPLRSALKVGLSRPIRHPYHGRGLR